MEKLMEYPEAVLGMGFAVGLAIIIGFIIVFWLVNVCCMMVGAKLANIRDRSFGKAFVASLLIAFLGSTCTGLLSMIHPVLGLVGLLVVPGIFIKVVYSCGLVEAIVAYIINIIASIAIMVGIILAIIFGFGISIDKVHENDKTQQKSKTEAPAPSTM